MMPKPQTKRSRQPRKAMGRNAQDGSKLPVAEEHPSASTFFRGEATPLGLYARTRKKPLSTARNAAKLKSQAIQSAASILRWKSSKVVRLVDSSSSDDEQQPAPHRRHHEYQAVASVGKSDSGGQQLPGPSSNTAPRTMHHRQRLESVEPQHSHHSTENARAAGSRRGGGSSMQGSELSASRVPDSHGHQGSPCTRTSYSCSIDKGKENRKVGSMEALGGWGRCISSHGSPVGPCSSTAVGQYLTDNWDGQPEPNTGRALYSSPTVSHAEYLAAEPAGLPDRCTLLASLIASDDHRNSWANDLEPLRPAPNCRQQGRHVVDAVPLALDLPSPSRSPGSPAADVAPALFFASDRRFANSREPLCRPLPLLYPRPATAPSRSYPGEGLLECLSQQQGEERQQRAGCLMAELASERTFDVYPEMYPHESPLMPRGDILVDSEPTPNAPQPPTADGGLLQGLLREAHRHDSDNKHRHFPELFWQ